MCMVLLYGIFTISFLSCQLLVAEFYCLFFVFGLVYFCILLPSSAVYIIVGPNLNTLTMAPVLSPCHTIRAGHLELLSALVTSNAQKRGPSFMYDSDALVLTIWTCVWGINHHQLCPLPKLCAPSFSCHLNLNHALLNTCSITSKTTLINDLITQQKVDMFFLSVTWQQPDDYSQVKMLHPLAAATYQTQIKRKSGALAVDLV